MATVIHTEDLAVSFDGETPVFEGLNLAIEKINEIEATY